MRKVNKEQRRKEQVQDVQNKTRSTSNKAVVVVEYKDRPKVKMCDILLT